MSRKVMVLLVLLTMVMLPVGSALAQGNLPPVFCGDLSEEDCAILQQSQVTMAELSAAAFDMTMDFGMTSDAPEIDSFQMSMAGNGAFSADAETLAMLEAYGQPEGDMTEMMAEVQAMVPELIQSVNGEISIVLTLPEELGAEAGLPNNELALNVVMVDGVVYLDLASLMPAEAQAESGMPSWMGIDLAALFETLMAMAEAEGGLDSLDMEGMMDMEAMMGMADPTIYEDLVAITRVEDVEVNGQAAAAFETTFDYSGLFDSEEYRAAFDEYMNSMMEMQGVPQDELPENFIDIIDAMMSGMSMQVTEWIGLEDYYSYHMDMAFAFEMDFEALAEMVPEDADAEDMPGSMAVNMSMVLDLSGFNEPVEVTAPEGAQVIDPMMFMGMQAPATAG